jgi:hydroxyacylglutathione hydrolase
MILDVIVVGALAVNCYIVGSAATREAIVIDPGDDTPRVMAVLAQKGLKAKYIVLTHAHFDHAGGAKKLKDSTGAKVIIDEKDAPLLKNMEGQGAMFGMRVPAPPQPDSFAHEGDIIKVGELELKVIETPGHTQGGISLYMQKQGIVFTGDTLFESSIGRTDLPGGNHSQILHSLKDKLCRLPDATKVYPGHGGETTIGYEKKNNPFF